MKKMIFLGIDGMDRDVVDRYIDSLPNIRRLRQTTPIVKFESIFPPDTTPAWSTIYTGLNPAQHGVINFVNLGDKQNRLQTMDVNDALFEGKTFWDEVGSMGFRILVVLPMNIYPGWQINGTLFTRSMKEFGKVRVWPQQKAAKYSVNGQLLSLVGAYTSDRHLDALQRVLYQRAAEEHRITLQALMCEEWDLIFAYYSTLDAVQHAFWYFSDPSHPAYPGQNPFESVIRNFYVMIDQQIGELLNQIADNVAVLVISDHGHGARPTRLVRINEVLLRAGFLAAKKGSVQKSVLNFKIITKKMVVIAVKTIGVSPWLVKLAKKFPFWKTIFASGSDFDWDKTIAYVTDLSAVKNYSYGGIRVRRDTPNFDAVVAQVIQQIEMITIPGECKPLVKWIKRADRVYNGPHIDKYPEIIFQLDERFGVGWDLGSDIFPCEADMSQIIPGAHRMATPVFYARGIDLLPSEITLMDIRLLVVRYFQSDAMNCE